MTGRQEEIPPEVRAFIAGYLDSVVQLETLLMLHAAPDKAWQADDVARELRIDRAWAEGQLDALNQQGLLVSGDAGGATGDATGGGGADRHYRYGPAAAATRAAVDGLARAYAERRVTVISLIFAKPADSLRAFSDAFRLRKDKEEPRG